MNDLQITHADLLQTIGELEVTRRVQAARIAHLEAAQQPPSEAPTREKERP